MSLNVQLLPTSAGTTSQVQPLTSFLINGKYAIDAGSLGFVLTADQLAGIQHVLLTHAHLDHTASLPIAIDTAFAMLKHPMRVHGTAPTIAAVRKHLFNNEVWVDFPSFHLLGTTTPCMEFLPITPREPFEIDGLRFTPIPVNHPVPTVGYLVESEVDAVLFTADTWCTEEIWQVAKRQPNLRAVIVECSFPDEMAALAERSGHLTPKLVASETAKIGRPVPVHCVHLKPSVRQTLRDQLAPYAPRGILPMEIGRVYHWR